MSKSCDVTAVDYIVHKKGTKGQRHGSLRSMLCRGKHRPRGTSLKSESQAASSLSLSSSLLTQALWSTISVRLSANRTFPSLLKCPESLSCFMRQLKTFILFLKLLGLTNILSCWFPAASFSNRVCVFFWFSVKWRYFCDNTDEVFSTDLKPHRFIWSLCLSVSFFSHLPPFSPFLHYGCHSLRSNGFWFR